MGADDWKERVALLHPFQVNMQMINNAQPHVLFMHCLPAFHDLQTTIGSAKAKEYGSLFPAVAQGEFEVQDVVFQSMHSVVFTQAQNRMHVTKAIL